MLFSSCLSLLSDVSPLFRGLSILRRLNDFAVIHKFSVDGHVVFHNTVKVGGERNSVILFHNSEKVVEDIPTKDLL